MSTVPALSIQFQLFQDAGLNTGGVWCVVEIPKKSQTAREALVDHIREAEVYNNKEKYVAYFGQAYQFELYETKNLELIPLEDWEAAFEERAKHWSEYELVAKAENQLEFDQAVFESQYHKFSHMLRAYLEQHTLQKVYKINADTFNTRNTAWGDQFAEDFVFELASSVLIVHFGWSS
ncbi:MAG: hypothetical protein AAFR61_17590 [Bacteroidota bacterium]